MKPFAAFISTFVLIAAARGGSVPVPGSPDVSVDRDLSYVMNGDPAERLDLYTPTAAPQVARPLIVWIHGGGFIAGSKSQCPGVPVVRAGFDLASIEYRFSTVAKYPAQIQDAKAAVRWLRSRRDELKIDADHIGAMGDSAGGHLAAMLGLTGGAHDFEPVGENKDVSDRVAAVCDCYGPTDFKTFVAQALANPSVKNVLDLTGDQDLYLLLTGHHVGVNPAMDRLACPVSFVKPNLPPFLILHGSKDNVVPLAQSEELATDLKKAGDDVLLQIIPGAGHGGAGFVDPRVLELVNSFFQRHLHDQNIPVRRIDLPSKQ